MTLTEEINCAWDWTGLEAVKIVAENDFGNFIVEDRDGKFWRLCPEEVYCEIVAKDGDELTALFQNEEFLVDWSMDRLVQIAQEKHGALKAGYKFYLVTPAVLGGAYNASNINTVPVEEIIRCSGELGKQIKDLPDGAQVKIEIVD